MSDTADTGVEGAVTVELQEEEGVNCTVSKTFVLWATDAGLTTNQTSQEFRFTWPC